MKDYVIGLDAGGTKTHCALYNHRTDEAVCLTFGPGNHEGMPGGFDELKEKLQVMLASVLGEKGISMVDVEVGVFGMSGVDTREQHRRISGILTELGVPRFELCNDAYLGVKAGSDSGVGICAINGTGYSTAGIDGTGKRIQVGGFGNISGDFGGNFEFVHRAVGSVYNQFFRGGPSTVMTSEFMRMLKITDYHDIMESIAGRIGEDYAGFYLAASRILFLAAGAGDAEACKILDESGRNYANAIAGIVRELSFPTETPVEVTLAGSLFAKAESPRVQQTMEGTLAELLPAYTFFCRPLRTPCVSGAVIWALEEAGATFSRDQIRKSFT